MLRRYCQLVREQAYNEGKAVVRPDVKASKAFVERTTYTVGPSWIECSMQGLSKCLICMRWASCKGGSGEGENKGSICEAVVNGKDDGSAESVGEFVFTLTAGDVPWNDLSKGLGMTFPKTSIVQPLM
jgi:hypothetical protein